MGNVLNDAWGYCDNDKYKVRLTGASIWVFDNCGNKLARFQHIPYAYKAKFRPGTNIIVAKSTAGYLAFYDLDKLELLKKFRTGINHSQDDGFDFSKDGKILYNIERVETCLKQHLAVYDAETFQLLDTLFTSDSDFYLANIECSDEGTYLLYISYNKAYICELEDKHKENKVKIPVAYADRLDTYMSWRDSGFSDKRNKWNKESDDFFFKDGTKMSLREVAKRFKKK